jgi:hypothetical protein
MSLTIHVSGLESVAVISPANPEFDAMATPLLGRLADRALRLKPYLAIVWNQSPRTVVAFTSEWIPQPEWSDYYGSFTSEVSGCCLRTCFRADCSARNPAGRKDGHQRRMQCGDRIA